MLHKLVLKYDNKTINKLELIPDATYMMKNTKNQTALNIAIKNKSDVRIINYMVKKIPELVRERGEDGNLPIHDILENGFADCSMIELFLSSYPDSIYCYNDSRELPLHSCIMYHNKMDVITKIIQAYPEGLIIKDRMGCTPFRYALFLGAGIDIIELMVKAKPECINMGDIIDFMECKGDIKNNKWQEFITKEEMAILVYLYVRIANKNLIISRALEPVILCAQNMT
jgi:ankyrin repeat protein